MNNSKDWKTMAIIAIVVALAFGLYRMKSKKSQSTASNQSSAIESTEPGKKPTVEFIDQTPKAQSIAQFKEERKVQNLRIELGLQTIPSKNLGESLQFGIRPKVFASGCGTGDFDLIKTIASTYKDKEFLLSIEPLVSNKKEIQRFRMSLGDIMNGRMSDVIVPKAGNGSRDYGVYLCRDQGNTQECGSKNTLGPRYWAGVLAKKADNNKVLYFQMFTVKSDVAYMIPAKKWNEATIKNLKKNFKPILESVNSLDKLQAMMNDLSSMPASVVPIGLDIPLPHTSPNCG